MNNKLQGFNVLLMGAAGSGKTYSIGTLCDTGLEVFYLALENGLESLLGYYRDNGKEVPPNLHWARIKPPATSFMDMAEVAGKINSLSFEALCKMTDPKRNKYSTMIDIFKLLNNFKDDRTGQEFGDVSTWGNDKVLVIDALTGINEAALNLVAGGKPVKNMTDWGIAQSQIINLITKLCDDCPCHFVLLSHIERETDQVLGGSKIMIATLGKALAPKIPVKFSDVILASRNGNKWVWDTANPTADTKTRNLTISNNIAPDFRLIYDKWKSRGNIQYN